MKDAARCDHDRGGGGTAECPRATQRRPRTGPRRAARCRPCAATSSSAVQERNGRRLARRRATGVGYANSWPDAGDVRKGSRKKRGAWIDAGYVNGRLPAPEARKASEKQQPGSARVTPYGRWPMDFCSITELGGSGLLAAAVQCDVSQTDLRRAPVRSINVGSGRSCALQIGISLTPASETEPADAVSGRRASRHALGPRRATQGYLSS